VFVHEKKFNNNICTLNRIIRSLNNIKTKDLFLCITFILFVYNDVDDKETD